MLVSLINDEFPDNIRISLPKKFHDELWDIGKYGTLEIWDIGKLITLLRKEVDAKERSFAIGACFNDCNENDEKLNFSCTSLICNDIVNQDIMSISSSYPHLKNLLLADSSNSKNRTIEILIVAKHYYRFIYRNVIRGKINEPIAVESLFGWVLTGYYDAISTTNNFNATHIFRVNSEICEHSNDGY